MEQETKNFEDSEFQVLETVSRLDEEKEQLQKSLILKKRKLEMEIENIKVLFFGYSCTNECRHFLNFFLI